MSAFMLVTAWCRIGYKPLPEQVLSQFTNDYVTRLQSVDIVDSNSVFSEFNLL